MKTPVLRLKRLRKTPAIRAMLRETYLSVSQLIAPIFVSEIHDTPREIQSMPGVFQLPLHALEQEIETISSLGIKAVLLFGLPADKDECGSASLREDGIVQRAVQLIKANHPELTVIADLCLCEYTSHGHCGILNGEMIDNDLTLKQFANQAVSLARAGVDWIAPSGMADGMVGCIREALDAHQYQDVAILSYAVKYSSYFYGPFREAALGAPQFGDRKTYQMDFNNRYEAIREAELDISEGADLLMVKPAMNYLDIICQLKSKFPEVPLCAYQVSGEYAMLKLAAKSGLIDEQHAFLESLTAIRRAGADLIITYFAKEIAQYIKQNKNQCSVT
jgi:porphobilinogen synthase